jgi:hypothetical protein
MKKVFVFEQRCLATVNQYFSVEAETEEEAVKMVESGQGYIESFTDIVDEGYYELFDIKRLPRKTSLKKSWQKIRT